jgi:methylmalonyl-CoA mutase, C-terminal domain
VGLSILSGAHMTILPRVIDLLRREGMEDVVVVGGGIIPEQDIPALLEMGVSAIFGPGTPLDDIVRFIEGAVARQQRD